MKILIAGGLGFIGSALANKLVTDNEITIVDPGVSRDRLVDAPNITVYYTSVQDWDNGAYDLVINCASHVGPIGLTKIVGHILPNMIDATQSCINIVRQSGCRLVHISSADVYGKNGWCRENTVCNVIPNGMPRTEYRIGKLACEEMVLTQLPSSLIIRPFNIIGKLQSGEWGFVVARFYHSIQCDASLQIFYNGEQQRAFCDINDLTNAILHLLNISASEIYNVGNPDNVITIHDLARMMLEISQKSLPIEFVNPEKIYLGFEKGNEKLPNIEKITNTGWRPQISLRESLTQIFKI